MSDPSKPRGYEERVGMLRDPVLKEDGIFADLFYNPNHAIARQLEWDATNSPQSVGLSHNVSGRVRKRDVSFGPRTEDGKRAWDTFATLLATTKKLGVSFYRYVYDRVTESGEIPNLADLIVKRAQHMNLAVSWESA